MIDRHPRKIYLAGPMAGKPKLNEDVFYAAEDYLTQRGHTVVVPHQLPAWRHGGGCPPSYRSAPDSLHAAACYLRAGLREMLGADEVWMLPGWESSVGARLELHVASACGIPILFFRDEITKAWLRIEPEIAKAAKALQEQGLLDEVLEATAEPHLIKRGDDSYSSLVRRVLHPDDNHPRGTSIQ